MKSSTKRSVLFLIATVITLSLIFLSAPKVWAETTDCKREITGTDIIDSSGVYCLTNDFEYTGTGKAIEITANDVVLDLNGHTISGPAVATTPDFGTSANGIVAVERKNVTVKNGTIKGFYYGVVLSLYRGTSGYLVEGITADSNTNHGIFVRGEGAVVRNNRVFNTGGSTVVSYARGIELYYADGARVLNNDVSDTESVANGNVRGIIVLYSANTVISGNRISETNGPGTGQASGLVVSASSDNALVEGNFVRETTSTSGTAYGAYISSDDVDIVNNRVSGAGTCFKFAGTDNRYRDNIASNCTGYSGGTALGDNND